MKPADPSDPFPFRASGDGEVSGLVHIAGPVITVGTLSRQRCAWCGAVIDERDMARTAVAIQPGESEEHAVEGLRRSHWEGLVLVDGGFKMSVEDPADGKVPPGSCMALDDDVTGPGR